MLGRLARSDGLSATASTGLSSGFCAGGVVPTARAPTVIGACAVFVAGAASPRGITTPGAVVVGGSGGGVSMSAGGSPIPIPFAGVTVIGGAACFGLRLGWLCVVLFSRCLSLVLLLSV